MSLFYFAKDIIPYPQIFREGFSCEFFHDKSAIL